MAKNIRPKWKQTAATNALADNTAVLITYREGFKLQSTAPINKTFCSCN